MVGRNLSPQKMFAGLAAEHRPLCAFNGGTKTDFSKWKKPELLAQWEDKGLISQKWVIDVQKHLSATLLVNIPVALKKGACFFLKTSRICSMI